MTVSPPRMVRKFDNVRERFLANRWGLLTARTIRQLGSDDAGDMAAGIAYYAFMSIFPLLLGAIAILGFVIPSETVQKELVTFFDKNLPTSSGLLQDNISALANARGPLGVISLLGLFWAGSAIFGSIGRAMNRAWGVQHRRPFYVTQLRDLLLSVSVGALFLGSLALTAISSILPSTLLPFGGAATSVLALSFSMVLLFGVIMLVYKYMPNTKAPWRDVWPGALLAAVLLIVLRSAFSIYLTHFANFQLIYGSIASIVALLVWIYASAFVLIIGVEFSAQYSRLRRSNWEDVTY